MKKNRDQPIDQHNDSGISPELLRARQRRVESRGRASRAFSRAADRRRIVPATIVGSLVLVGVGVTDAAVQHTIPPTTSTTVPPTTTPPPAPSVDAAQLNAVAKSLAADQAALAALQNEAANAGSPSTGSGASSTPSNSGSAAASTVKIPGGVSVSIPSVSNSNGSTSQQTATTTAPATGSSPATTTPAASNTGASSSASTPTTVAAAPVTTTTAPPPSTTTTTAPATHGTTGASGAG